MYKLLQWGSVLFSSLQTSNLYFYRFDLNVFWSDLSETSLSLWHKKKEYLWDWIDSSFQHSFECLFLRFSLSDFCLRSRLFFSHSLSRSSLVRSLSLCFFGFFFLWWLVATCCCWWGDSALPSGGWWLLTLSSGSLPSETGLWGGVNSRSITGRPWVWGPGEGFWVTWLGVLWTSLFVWSTSFCLFTARLSGESKGTGRFCEIKEEKRNQKSTSLNIFPDWNSHIITALMLRWHVNYLPLQDVSLRCDEVTFLLRTSRLLCLVEDFWPDCWSVAAASCEEETERHEDTGTQTCWTDFTTAYCQISGEN